MSTWAPIGPPPFPPVFDRRMEPKQPRDAYRDDFKRAVAYATSKGYHDPGRFGEYYSEGRAAASLKTLRSAWAIFIDAD